MPSVRPFSVDTPLVRLAVTVEDGVVTEIVLHGQADRAPATEAERLVARELQEYMRGERTDFTFRVVARGSAFDRQVWNALLQIPYGETRTYGELARQIGRPGAARAVGSANRRNPIALAIPCHRVVAAGGRLGGYGGGVDLKRRLLDLEIRNRPRRSAR